MSMADEKQQAAQQAGQQITASGGGGGSIYRDFHENNLRMECVKQAVVACNLTGDDVVATATKIYSFVKGDVA